MAESIQALVPRMRDICGASNVITDPLELRTYECDGLTAHRCSPGLVVLPESAEQVAQVVAACAQAGIPSRKKIRGPGIVFWGTPARPIKDYLKELAALSRLTRASKKTEAPGKKEE